MIIILMGVAGAGKTTIGRRLAAELGWPFLDGDDFHSPANIQKMACGVPLTDADREAWLAILRERIAGLTVEGRPGIIACSALKQRYRDLLTVNPDQVRFVYLQAGPGLIRERLECRRGHFLKSDLLESQFKILEEPEGVLTIDAAQEPSRITETIRRALGLE